MPTSRKNDLPAKITVGKLRFLLHMAFQQGERSLATQYAVPELHDEDGRKQYVGKIVEETVFNGLGHETKEQYDRRKAEQEER